MADAPHLLTDLRLRLRHRDLRPVYELATEGGDLAAISGRDNLAQALTLRLLTPRGELAELGHPDYGCRLHELIGRPNTPATRDLAKLHVLEALGAEPRVAAVEAVDVRPSPASRSRVDIDVRVRPAGPAAPVVIGPDTLQLGP